MYNDNPSAVERCRDELDQLLTGSPVLFTADDTMTLAYRLREALFAARKNGIEPYASLRYSFKQYGNGQLLATPKEKVQVAAATAPVTTTATPLAPSVGAVFSESVDHFEVVQTAIAHPSTPELTFPNFSGDKERLTLWAHAKGFDISFDPLTLRRHSDGIDD